MTPTLLAYQIDPKKLGKMQIVCLRLGIRVQAVDPADFGQTIGALAGVLPREPDAPAELIAGDDVRHDGMITFASLQTIARESACSNCPTC